jgi:aminoglycoside phosphotransferase (APT) family kinase protein
MDDALPRALIAQQFPHWAHLPVSRVDSSGTDNHIWRMGPNLCLRMPKADWAADAVARECEHLPGLSGLPLAVPRIVARGEPDQSYPYVWSVCEWIEGQTAALDALFDPVEAARVLAQFIRALQANDATKGPRSSPQNNLRGGPLGLRDKHTRRAIANLAAEIDARRVLDIWTAALAAPPHEGPGVWIHSDLKEGNLLARDGRLTAVIDFGMLAAGDPAPDLTPAWSFFNGESEEAFLAALDAGPAAIARAKGWAVTCAATAWDFYRDRNPTLTRISKQTLAALTAN